MSIVTPNINLPQWESDQKPSREAFNNVFATIDAAVGGKAEKATTYTKLEVDSAFAGKANKGELIYISPTIRAEGSDLVFEYAYQNGAWQKIDGWIYYAFQLSISNLNTSDANGNLYLSMPYPSGSFSPINPISCVSKFTSPDYANVTVSADGILYAIRTDGTVSALKKELFDNMQASLSLHGEIFYMGGI